MRVVLSSTDLSFVQGAQIALDAHGIATVIGNGNSTALPGSATTLAVVADVDFEQAVHVLPLRLAGTPTPVPTPCYNPLFEEPSSRPDRHEIEGHGVD